MKFIYGDHAHFSASPGMCLGGYSNYQRRHDTRVGQKCAYHNYFFITFHLLPTPRCRQNKNEKEIKWGIWD